MLNSTEGYVNLSKYAKLSARTPCNFCIACKSLQKRIFSGHLTLLLFMKKLIYSLLFWLISVAQMATAQADLSALKTRSLVEQVAMHYRPPSMDIGDPEKYYWPKAMARLQQFGVTDSLANFWITAFASRSPFHFTLLGMARLMHLFPAAPAMRAHRLLILQRVFARTDNHNVLTSEGTENHINMARTSGYLFAQAALQYPEHFPDAARHMQMLKEWLLTWAQRTYRHGTAEWNSSIYTFYNLAGWLNLYDFAKDPEVKAAAEAVLDYYATEMALHYSFGLPGGSEMRGNGVPGNAQTASAWLGWYWFGNNAAPVLPWVGSQYIQIVHAVTSGYRPHSAILALAEKTKQPATWYKSSRPSYLFETPSFSKQFFYADSLFTLGSCTGAWAGWTGASTQIVNWKLLINNGAEALPFVVSGNGLFFDEWTGKSRNPFTQVAQHKNVLVQLTCLPASYPQLVGAAEGTVNDWQLKWKRDFALRFPEQASEEDCPVNFGGKKLFQNRSFIALPAEARVETGKKYSLVYFNSVVLLVNFVAGPPADPVEKTVKGQKRRFLIDEAGLGEVCGFIVKVLHPAEIANRQKLKKAARFKKVASAAGKGIACHTPEGQKLQVLYGRNGTYQVPLYNWGYGATRQYSLPTSPPYVQPQWPAGKWHGRLPTIFLNGKKQGLAAPWPVIEGPEVKLKNTRLHVTPANGQQLLIDFRQKVPLKK